MGADEQLTFAAPLPGGVRSGESLWSIVHRFAWLNQIGASEVGRFLGVPYGGRFNLLTGCCNGTCRKEPTKQVDADYRRLGLTEDEFRLAILPRFVTPGEGLCFCPQCAEYAYHSVAFNTGLFKKCPMHGVNLVSACPLCRAPISTYLGPRTLGHPYACCHCGFPLYAKDDVFFTLHSKQAYAKLGELVQWLSTVDKAPLVWGDMTNARVCYQEDYRLPDPNFMARALADACGVATPAAYGEATVQRKRLVVVKSRASVTRALSMEARALKAESVQQAKSIYRGYLRVISSRDIGSDAIQEDRKLPVSTRLDELSPNLAARLPSMYAMLLLRYAWEGYRRMPPANWDAFEFFRLRRSGVAKRIAKITPQVPRYIGIDSGDDLRVAINCADAAILAWISAHVQLVELQALYQEAKRFGEVIASRGWLNHNPRLRGELIPDLFVAVQEEAAALVRLEFWTSGSRIIPDNASAWYDAQLAEQSRLREMLLNWR